MIKQLLRNSLGESLIGRIRSNSVIQHLYNEPAGEMTVGIGAGLAFNAGPSNRAYASGDNELPMQRALADCLKSGGVFYDIGANVGFFTVLGARLVGPSGLVYAFEPSAENAAYVRLNAQLNGFRNVHVIEKAVSSESGSAKFWVAEYSGGAALATAGMPPDAKKQITVPVVSVDDLLFTLNWPQPSILKIDVEGAEMAVLQGMAQTLHKVRPILLYEIDDEKPEGFEHKYKACEALMRQADYRVRRLEDSYADIDWIVGHAIAIPAENP